MRAGLRLLTTRQPLQFELESTLSCPFFIFLATMHAPSRVRVAHLA
jgi:hypothetical protein